MRINSKKIITGIILIFMTAIVFGKSKKNSKEPELPQNPPTPAIEKPKPPSWMSDTGRFLMFPQSEYISSLGIASSADGAKNKAAAGISEYIKTEVSGVTQSRYRESEKNGKVDEEKLVDEEITLLTNQEIFSLEYTEAWHNAETSEYYCLAFVEKAAAWNRMKSKLVTITSDITAKIETAETDTTGFWRTLTLGEVLSKQSDFYAFYDFAVIVNPAGAKSFVATEELFRLVEQTIQQEKSKQTVWLTVNGDKNGMVYRAIAKSLENKGFTVSNSRGKFVAVADLTVEMRQEGDMFVTYPGITLEVKNALGSQIASFSQTAKKTVGFERAALEEKAYRTLEKSVDELFKQ